jgi:hypothetical protein
MSPVFASVRVAFSQGEKPLNFGGFECGHGETGVERLARADFGVINL